MAYAQQPRYGGPQRPAYEHQQASYASSAQAYAAEYDYADRNQDSHYEHPAPGGVPRQYPDTYGAGKGDYSNVQNRWQDGAAPYGSGAQYGQKSQPGGGRQPLQQPNPKALKPEGQAYNDPRNGIPQQKSRFPARDPYQPQTYGYQSGGGQQPQHDYPLEQDPWQANGGHNYGDASYAPPDNWASDQQHGQGSTGPAKGYHKPNQDVGYQPQGIASGIGKGPSPDGRGNVAYAPSSRNEVSAPRSAKGQSQSSSTKSESSQRSKPAPHRIIETPISPDTVAWDNPFPTFPLKPKKAAHSSSRSMDGSTGETASGTGLPQDRMYDSRPQTASNKSSSSTITQRQGIDQPIKQPSNQQGGFPVQKSRWPKEVAHNNAAQARPSTRDGAHAVGGVDRLKPLPIVNGRHSEDNRARPTVHGDAVIDPGYERSRTMPTAISETLVQSGHQPGQPYQSDWQEPGPVAGYYGPEDKGYLPTSPVDGSRHRPYAPVTAHSEESRHFGDGLAQTQNNAYQPHAPHDSLNDFFDDYYDTQQEHHPTPQEPSNRHRSPIEEDMPNFDAMPASGTIHGRGMTIDHHLQPQQISQEYPPMPPPPQEERHRNYGNDPNNRSQFPPRSRSQPNLKDRRSPRAEDDKTFDFGVPGGSQRPPVTAPAASGYVGSDNGPLGYSNSGSQPRDRPPRGQGPQGPMRSPGYGAEVRNGPGPNYPPPRTGLPPIPYQANGPTDRYRSPPLQDGRPRQGPMKPPEGGPSPVGRNAGRGQPTMGYPNSVQPDRFRSPPLKDGRATGGPMRPYDGGPSPVDRIGPTSPPSQAPSNPDALPSHPAPVRPGLMEGSPVNQAAKPPPVRQYNAAPSPMQQSNSTQKPGSSHSSDNNKEPAPVTHQELEQLRQTTVRRPDDQAAQLTLAKKLVEASTVLVDERSDPRTKSKSREKYNSDAYKMVKKLSSNGYTEATFYLADAYSRGALGLESDTREAFKLYQTAAKSGHAQAAYRVAVCCEIGQEEGGGTTRDAVKAVQWYKRAATLGDTPAMYKMGIISLKGLLGQPRNPKEAMEWLKKAADRADRENPHALHELALLYSQPKANENAGRDEAYARQLFTQAAKLGYKFSQFRLGCAYEYGLLGCPVDPRQSIAWYSKAAVQEEHQSELALSGWYLTGSEGVLQQSDTEAYLWARKAAQAGLAKAEYAMGYFTEVGIGAPANLDDAKRWYWRSASQNFQKARDRLEDLRKGGGTKQKMRVSRSNMKKQSDGECLIM